MRIYCCRTTGGGGGWGLKVHITERGSSASSAKNYGLSDCRPTLLQPRGQHNACMENNILFDKLSHVFDRTKETGRTVEAHVVVLCILIIIPLFRYRLALDTVYNILMSKPPAARNSPTVADEDTLRDVIIRVRENGFSGFPVPKHQFFRTSARRFSDATIVFFMHTHIMLLLYLVYLL